jgi:transcriptional regulator with AAA-type ATPase domain
MKTAYVTFHVYNYGIGFTKNILGAFYSGQLGWDRIETEWLNQQKLENAFQNDKADKKIYFDKVYYLHVNQTTINKITSTRRMKKTDCLPRIDQDELMKNQYQQWVDVININPAKEINELKTEIDEINKLPDSFKAEMLQKYWRIIHYYNIEDQIYWLIRHSNSKEIYNSNRFESINLEDRFQLNDLHDYKKICTAFDQFLREFDIVNQYDKIIINISNVGYEVQVAWFTLAQAGRMNSQFHFISSYDNKDQDERFKDFRIQEVHKNILEQLSDQIKFNEPDTKSEKRNIAAEEFKIYLDKGFSILILGERGCGKTRLIQNNKNVGSKTFLSVSAAAFDDDSKLESELFGYEQGAFTGATKTKTGLFHTVNGGGILFIDELHAMTKRVQEKLMASLSTDNEGYFLFKRVGGKKIEKAKFTIVFASNKSLDELKYKYLLPDFFDRVVQYVVKIPPLREARDDIKLDWKNTWHHQKFSTRNPWPDDEKLVNWLGTLDFPGNWRDLQRIAIWYDAFLNFGIDAEEITGFKSALEYVKSKYQEICLRKSDSSSSYDFEFSTELTVTGQAEDYMKQIALWAKDMYGGSFKKAAGYLRKNIGDSIAEKTLYNWAHPENKAKKNAAEAHV